MLNVAVVGASGYAGAELCRLIVGHPNLNLAGLFVSAGSEDQGKNISELYGSLQGRCSAILEPLHDVKQISSCADAVFLATDHRVSHDLVPNLIAEEVTVFDLSGAFRLSDPDIFKHYYGFSHEHQNILEQAVYALGEYVDVDKLKKTRIISLPGCYPTASQLALRPLIDADLLDRSYRPSINAVSGVSGAGRKAKLGSSFCEVSLNAYGVFTHRHLPEIVEHLGMDVVFNAHLGSFKRGILATVTAKLKENVSGKDAGRAFVSAYKNKPLIRLKDNMPKLQDVQGLPYCDIGIAEKDGYIVICSAIDNLLKGAAAQAVQVLNLRYGFNETEGLL